MKVSPWILGAAALVPVAGALAGSNIGTEPVGLHDDVIASLPETSASYERGGPALEQERLPDHYAMETPEGRVEIADLALRGRYRDQSRYGQRTSYSDGYDLDAELDRMEARWDIDASTSRAAAALDAQQPSLPRAKPRYAQAPHYASMQQARVGENAAEVADGVIEIAEPEPAPVRVAALQTSTAPTARNIDVGAELSLQR